MSDDKPTCDQCGGTDGNLIRVGHLRQGHAQNYDCIKSIAARLSAVEARHGRGVADVVEVAPGVFTMPSIKSAYADIRHPAPAAPPVEPAPEKLVHDGRCPRNCDDCGRYVEKQLREEAAAPEKPVPSTYATCDYHIDCRNAEPRARHLLQREIPNPDLCPSIEKPGRVCRVAFAHVTGAHCPECGSTDGPPKPSGAEPEFDEAAAARSLAHQPPLGSAERPNPSGPNDGVNHVCSAVGGSLHRRACNKPAQPPGPPVAPQGTATDDDDDRIPTEAEGQEAVARLGIDVPKWAGEIRSKVAEAASRVVRKTAVAAPQGTGEGDAVSHEAVRKWLATARLEAPAAPPVPAPPVELPASKPGCGKQVAGTFCGDVVTAGIVHCAECTPPERPKNMASGCGKCSGGIDRKGRACRYCSWKTAPAETKEGT